MKASRVHVGTVGVGRKDGRSMRDACEAGTGILGDGSSRISYSPSPFRDAARRFRFGSRHAELQYPLKPLSSIFPRNCHV